MRIIDQQKNGIYLLAISGYELATLISSARWATNGAQGELTEEAVSQLKQVVQNYDRALEKKTKRSEESVRK